MPEEVNTADLHGVWSATPTPLTDDFKIDIPSVERMVNHHYQLGVKGLFVGGTCGEGALLPRSEVRSLITAAAEACAGRLVLSVQVTDNSAPRVLDNIREAQAEGADIAVLCEPWWDFPRATDAMKEVYYRKTIEESPLPVGFYLRRPYLPLDTYRELLMHPNVCMIKDSSLNEEIMHLAAAIHRQRRDIAILTGDEFGTGTYLRAGYSGILCGGGILVGGLMRAMLAAAQSDDYDRVAEIQAHSDRILYTTYGGREFASWISGLKYLLKRMGVFTTDTRYADYPLPESVKRDIDALLTEEHDTLLPYMRTRKATECPTQALKEEASDFRTTLNEETGVLEIHLRCCPSMKRLLTLDHMTPHPQYCEHCTVLYRETLEQLGFDYEVDLSQCHQAVCRRYVKRRRNPDRTSSTG